MGVCGLAVARGRDEERLAAAGYLANWALTLVLFRKGTSDLQDGIMLVDLALLLLYVWLALRSQRHWPMFAAGFQLLAIITHLGRILDPRISGWAYITAEIIWSYLVLFAIAYGAWTAPAAYAESADPPTSDEPGDTRR